jgi:DNA-binding transcriptional LysR family regulator
MSGAPRRAATEGGTRTMNSSQLKCFLAVAEQLNFSRAAESLFMTQTAVTYQVAALEKELSVKLFDRSRQKVSLTDAGRELVPWAEQIDAAMANAAEHVRAAQRGSGGRLSVGTYGDVLLQKLPLVVGQLLENDPDLAVDLRQRTAHELVDGLRDGSVDVAVMTSYAGFAAQQSWLEVVPLFEDGHCAVVPATHHLAGCTSVTWDDLKDERLVLFAERDLIHHEDSLEGLSDVCYLDSPQSVRALVAAGYGVSVCVAHVCDTSDGLVAAVPLEGASMGIVACYRRGDASAETIAFVDALRDAVSAWPQPALVPRG